MASVKDEFYWLGQINKASLVINTEEGLLDKSLTPRIADGLQQVLEAGDQPGGQRPKIVIEFEPLLIDAVGIEATTLHVGRSSQDMITTGRYTITRDETLSLADQILEIISTLLKMAEKYADHVIPNYTNGVAAQPNSYGHYLLGYVAGFERDVQRLREFYARLDRSPMGTTVLNGTSWPLNRERMASYLGFSALAENAYDAVQISANEIAVEAGSVAINIALHVGSFIQEVMAQYSQSRPWILLKEGGDNTYASSAMPQKRNPGLLNRTRADASRVISMGMGQAIIVHNLSPGMPDGRGHENSVVLKATTKVLADFNRILDALVFDPDRALEELNNDWTATQEVADVLVRRHNVPFRVGHHFASHMVSYAKKENLTPLNFPYQEAKRIYTETLSKDAFQGGEFPMAEDEFYNTLNPVAIVQNRATVGGPQPSEMARMLSKANHNLTEQQNWVQDRKQFIASSLQRLDDDFEKLLPKKDTS